MLYTPLLSKQKLRAFEMLCSNLRIHVSRKYVSFRHSVKSVGQKLDEIQVLSIFCGYAKMNPPRFPNPPAGVGGSLISPLCDAMVPHSLHFLALLGLCPRCLGSHHSARYVHTHNVHIHTIVDVIVDLSCAHIHSIQRGQCFLPYSFVKYCLMC